MESLLGTSLEDPRTMAVMSAVQGLLGGRGLLQGLASGAQAYGGTMQAARQQEEAQKARAIQLQMQQLALQQAQEAKQKQAAIEQAYRGAMRTPQQMAMQANGGPTNAAAQAIPSMSPGVDQGALIQSLMQADPQAAYQMLQPKAPEYKTVGNSLVQVGPGGVKEAYRAPDKPEAQDPFIRFLVQSGIDPMSPQGQNILRQRIQKETSHQPGVTVSYGAPVAGVDPSGKSVFFQPSKDGGAPAIISGVAPEKKEKPLTESQAKAAALASQMQAAEGALSKAGIDPSKLGDQMQTRIAQGAGNFLVTPNAQMARQAQEQWAESYLRFKTGAASTEQEVIRNVRTFFPQPGDSPEVVRQKAVMRQQAAHDVRIAAGGAPIETVSTPTQRQVVRTGTLDGRKVVQYSDGTTDYAD